MCAWQFFAEASAKHGNAEFKKVPVGCCVPFTVQAPTGSTHWLPNCCVIGGSTVRNQLTGGIAASLLCHSVVALGWCETEGSCSRKLRFPPILSCFDGVLLSCSAGKELDDVWVKTLCDHDMSSFGSFRIEYSNLLGDWTLSGASIFERLPLEFRDGLQFYPMSDRSGWHIPDVCFLTLLSRNVSVAFCPFFVKLYMQLLWLPWWLELIFGELLSRWCEDNIRKSLPCRSFPEILWCAFSTYPVPHRERLVLHPGVAERGQPRELWSQDGWRQSLRQTQDL